MQKTDREKIELLEDTIVQWRIDNRKLRDKIEDLESSLEAANKLIEFFEKSLS